MATENETIADIIAEMRRYATDYYGRTIENGGEKGNPGKFYLDMAQFAKVNADRLDAAAKRMEWMHKKELETKDAVIQTEVAAREAEREAHERGIDRLKKQVGNAEKLRAACAKAAESAAEIMERVRHKDGLAFNTANYIAGIAKDALAAPPRNCDRFANAVEAMAEMKRVHSYCAKENRHCLEDCPDCGKEWCSLAWLFAPATESEAQA